MRSRHVEVRINLDQVRANAEEIRRRTGVRLMAVIKADAYGLGAPRVADALAGVADDFCYFTLHEAREVGRPGLVLGPPEDAPSSFAELNLRPAIANVDDARRYRGLRVGISVDTGMQRFGCAPEELDELLALSNVEEIYSHASTAQAADAFARVARGRGRRLHVAASGLLNYPPAWLDAVRPGYALYRGAVRVSTRLHSVRRTRGPVGYTGFHHEHVGIILAGYSNGVGPGPVLVNGRMQLLLEVGMNSSYVSTDPADRAGDEVVLLGDGLDEEALGAHFHIRPHEVLCRYTSMGQRIYCACGAAQPDRSGGATRFAQS